MNNQTNFGALKRGAFFTFTNGPKRAKLCQKLTKNAFRAIGEENFHGNRQRVYGLNEKVSRVLDPQGVEVTFDELPQNACFVWTGETNCKANRLWKWSDVRAGTIPEPLARREQCMFAIFIQPKDRDRLCVIVKEPAARTPKLVKSPPAHVHADNLAYEIGYNAALEDVKTKLAEVES